MESDWRFGIRRAAGLAPAEGAAIRGRGDKPPGSLPDS
jgi:hypothetical protein